MVGDLSAFCVLMVLSSTDSVLCGM